MINPVQNTTATSRSRRNAEPCCERRFCSSVRELARISSARYRTREFCPNPFAPEHEHKHKHKEVRPQCFSASKVRALVFWSMEFRLNPNPWWPAVGNLHRKKQALRRATLPFCILELPTASWLAMGTRVQGSVRVRRCRSGPSCSDTGLHIRLCLDVSQTKVYAVVRTTYRCPGVVSGTYFSRVWDVAIRHADVAKACFAQRQTAAEVTSCYMM